MAIQTLETPVVPFYPEISEGKDAVILYLNKTAVQAAVLSSEGQPDTAGIEPSPTDIMRQTTHEACATANAKVEAINVKIEELDWQKRSLLQQTRFIHEDMADLESRTDSPLCSADSILSGIMRSRMRLAPVSEKITIVQKKIAIAQRVKAMRTEREREAQYGLEFAQNVIFHLVEEERIGLYDRIE